MNELQSTFNGILRELISQLKLEPIDKNVVIKWASKDDPTEISRENVFDLGVTRLREDEILTIVISPNYKKFLDFILVRESYYCFIPEELKSKEIIRVCINQIVENDLEGVVTKEIYYAWKNTIKNTILDRDFIRFQMDELKRFFLLEATAPYESTVQFFFIEIRKNAVLFSKRNLDELYYFIFRHYSAKIHQALFKKDNIETLYALIKIFYENEKYLNLEDYYNYFTQYKEKNKIKTSISLRTFKKCMRWINKSTIIAPSYYVNKTAVGIYPIVCSLTFNPIIERYKIKKMIFSIPFLQSPKFSSQGFITHFKVIFYVPNEYVSELIKFFDVLEQFGYIIKKELLVPQKSVNFINLNYFLDFTHNIQLMNPKSQNFNKEREIEKESKYYYDQSPIPLSILEFLLINRISNVSITGLTFDKRKGTLLSLKESIDSEKIKHEESYTTFYDTLNKIRENEKFKNQFQELLKKNQHFGSFYIYETLTNVLKYTKSLENLLSTSSNIHNISQLQNFLNRNYISHDLEENTLYQDPELTHNVFTNVISKYFDDKHLFKAEVKKLELFCDTIKACYKLLIFDVSDILYLLSNSKEVDRIYSEKKERVEMTFSSPQIMELTNEKIESTIEKFLAYSPAIITPLLHNTILVSPSANYFIYCLLEDIPFNDNRITDLKSFFPRMMSIETKVFSLEKKLTYLEIYASNIKEKDLFFSTIYKLFGDHLLELKRFFWKGDTEPIGLEQRDIFEFHKGTFLYKEGFFKQIFLFMQQILSNKTYTNLSSSAVNSSLFFSSNFTMDKLIKTIKHRISLEKIEYSLEKLNQLTKFRKNLKSNLLEIDKFIEYKSKDFFKAYINSIKFIPRFSRFGLTQYDLILGPSNYDLIDLRLLLSNTFQSLIYPASLDPYQIIHITYIFPYKNPNKSYLNWLIESKKCVREYCLFHRKKVYSTKNFSRNLDKDGWNYFSNTFEQYIQNILFNPSYSPDLPFLHTFVLDLETDLEQNYSPNTKEFNALSQIYTRSSIDIKSYLGTNKLDTIQRITMLLKKELIFPYLLIKNLDFKDKVTLILPDIEKSIIEQLIKIFNFFNICNIFEIEGEYYLYGFEKKKFFENGLLIEIWFPSCELDEFFNAFDRLFEYLKIKYYIVLSDMVDGNHLLKQVYGNLKFLKDYNPLKNLKWNSQDKKWMNVKLFKEKFEPNYPNLITKKDSGE